MALTKLQFRPGFNREQTSYTNEGGWVDGNKVRFRAGLPETIGGWVRSSEVPFLGVCRALINWRSLTGTSFVGLGTNLKYYIERGGALFDVTPIRLTTAAGDITFSATDGSTTLVVTHIAHGARANDFVTFSGAVSLGGTVTAPVLNREYQITEIISSSSYAVELAAPADAADTGDGGVAVVGAYQISIGLVAAFRGDGWGASSWGSVGWGEGADTTIPGERVRLWSHTTYGESLIINPRGGGLYYWDAGLGLSTRAQNIAAMMGADEVPVQANLVRLSSRDRHVLAFGCTPLFGGPLDPLLIRFSSQENLLDWYPRSTNTAGDLRLGSGNQILAAEATNQEIVVLTDTSAHAMQFIGPPFTFGLRDLASGVSVAGPNCAVSANNVVYWMGLGEFYAYDGVVRELPCTIKEYVFDLTMDMEKRDIVFAAHNSAFSEIWWFYPCRVSGDCTRYAVYNYEQQVWYYGTLSRSAWVDRGVSLKPVAAALDGYLYAHESGLNDGSQNPSAPISAYIQSSPLDIAEGEQFMFVRKLIPDVTFRTSTTAPQVMMTLTAQNFPGGDPFNPQPSNISRSATVPVEQFTEQTFVRLRGRAVSLKVESNLRNTAWRLGSPRIDVRTDGRR